MRTKEATEAGWAAFGQLLGSFWAGMQQASPHLRKQAHDKSKNGKSFFLRT
jgi:hypothetical protein